MLKKQLDRFKEKVSALKTNVVALYLAYGDARTPWLARVIILLTVAYAVSPVDLIPDFIPIVGLLDDLLLLPLGLWLAIKLVPTDVWAECKLKSQDMQRSEIGINGIYMTVLIVTLWIMLAVLCYAWFAG